MMLGIDLVELSAARELRKSADLRWRARVFTYEENARIDRAADPERELWTLWAAKESYYKARQQHGPWKRGSWRNVAVLALPAAVRFTHAFDEATELLCCVCSDHPHWVARVQRGDSARVRLLVLDELARRGLRDAAIERQELGEGRLGPPRIVGSATDASGWELSLAHDGPWVGFALGHLGLEGTDESAELRVAEERALELGPL
ncbi:MAG: 4'-phosphopantetheinyl transferase superfamily protein [Planctomycetes bacterium]|nr:4'-phosphopantetheinyl transferase superfamily protein [Planctomycetota bacterium]